jgi:hypothetical protein
MVTTAQAVDVSLYRVFETSVTNSKSYANKFTSVTLNADFTAPSGKKTSFRGFYDGNGSGGQTGTTWKLRFMPDETGTWNYSYSWTDGTAGGSGSFACVSSGKGKGVLRGYQGNPHWYAYNGTTPVFLKSYYIKPHGSITQPISWVGPNVYQKLIDRGYNHLQMASLLPIAYMGQQFEDGPGNTPLALMTDSDPGQMRLDVWKHTDDHVRWLSDRDVGVHFFEGFQGKRDYDVDFGGMSDSEKHQYVSYVCARLAPFANIAGWNYTWETEGDGGELELADLLAQYDPWNHLRTYHDEDPQSNNYSRSEYTFAAIEDHGNGDYPDCIAAYKNKPVFMSEGNDLWRSCWGATEETIRRQAWHVTCAAASFTWNDLPSCDEGNESTDIFSWSNASRAVDVLTSVMTTKVNFAVLTPSQGLLSSAGSNTYCLAQSGSQYLVYEEGGGSFTLNMSGGTYSAQWIDTKTGNSQSANGGSVSGGSVSFTTPNSSTDWVLVATTESAVGVRQDIARGPVLGVTGAGPAGSRLEVLDSRGRTLMRRNAASGIERIDIPASARWTPGIYFVKHYGPAAVSTVRLARFQ